MYRNIKLGEFNLTFNKFRKNAKDISMVYKSGIRNWDADHCMNYSMVLGTFRIIFSIDKKGGDCCG